MNLVILLLIIYATANNIPLGNTAGIIWALFYIGDVILIKGGLHENR